MKRRKAREYALQLLFQSEFINRALEKKDFEEFWSDKDETTDVQVFTEKLVKGTIDKLKEIDNMIEKVSENWFIERMAAVDRNILRFAAYELFFRRDIPPAVTINEALEIAKKYSSSESVSFLNGILDKLAKEAGKA